MDIVALDPSHIEAVVTLYQRAIRSVPHCRFVPSRQACISALQSAAAERGPLFVAVDAGVPRGFAALNDHGETVEGWRTAEITALFIDDVVAGNPLLDAVTTWAHAREVQRLFAFPATHFHCPFPGYNGGWDGLSDRVRLVAQLLTRRGFTPFHRELHMEYAGARHASAPLSAPQGIRVVQRTAAQGQVVAAAFNAEREVGICEYSRVTRISDAPGAEKWGFVWNLEVAKAERRRGIGRYLLSFALTELSEQECCGVWLTTEAGNWPAQTMYLALGFVVVDGSTCFRKDL
jgi:ribosomal protein S18 acetylase RimI-like enzyme